MVEPADAKELIDAAIERAESERDGVDAAERTVEKRFGRAWCHDGDP